MAIPRAMVWREWPAVAIRLSDLGAPGADGFHRSWIMLFPEGTFAHPQYGKLDFSARKLGEIKRNFEDGAREIDIALDRDHDQGAATGWLERLEMRPALSTGATAAGAAGQQPAGLWGLVRWTPLGVQLLQEQQYRYFSPEFKPDYTNQKTGKKYHNVLIGGALTNRPFLKVMSAVQLAEISTRPWGQVDKACLPRSAFLDPGDPKHPSTWRLPVYEGAGPKDASGRYTRRGKLNIHGVEAALRAIHGARTGAPMSGVPSGVVAKLERWIERYGDGGDGGDEMAKGSKKADEPMDDEQYDEADREGDYDPDEDTHGALTTDGHTHGKYAEHAHDDDADHSAAELADEAEDDEEPAPKMSAKRGGGKAKKMSEGRQAGSTNAAVKLAELEAELARLREDNDAQARKLYEREVGEQLSEAAAALGEDAVFSKVFNERYRAVMLSDAVREDATLRQAIHNLVASAAKHVVDTRARGASFDQEQRRTRKAGQSAGDDDALLQQAERIALSEHKKALARLSDDERQAVFLAAAKEVGYKGAE